METVLKDSFGLRGQVKWIKSKNGKVISESPWMQNQILANDAHGIYLILDRLASDNTYSLNIKYADLGDGQVAADADDTGLGNAVVRSSISGEGSNSRSGLTADFRFFFSNSLTPNQTYYEFGMVVDGSSTLASGQYFNRLLLTTPLVKSSGEDHTIVCRITGSV